MEVQSAYLNTFRNVTSGFSRPVESAAWQATQIVVGDAASEIRHRPSRLA